MLMKEERVDVEPMMSLKDVKDILGVSYGVLNGHIAKGLIPAYRVTGESVSAAEVAGGNVFGLRIYPADLRAFLDSRRVR